MELLLHAIGHTEGWLGTLILLAAFLLSVRHLGHLERAQWVGNLFNLTRQYREIWSMLVREPKLKRVLDPKADLKIEPLTMEEQRFVRFLILHLDACFEAGKVRMFTKPEALRHDIRQFFALPVPRAVWDNTKGFQDEDFVRFVEESLEQSSTG